MCGLVGVAGNITAKHEKAFKDLLVVDALRGPHSTGVAQVNTRGGTEIVKHAMLPQDFFLWQPFKDIMLQQNNVLIGHNRWATQGAVNKVNAHPFELGDIIGVHNGTLRRQSLLPDSKDFEVDSENILHSINKLGVRDTYNKIDGAAALVWWNTEKETLHFLRNNERPFYYCFTKDNKTLFWASEEWMLLSILYRQDIEHGEVVETDIHREYVFEVPIHANITSYPNWSLSYTILHEPYVYVIPAKKVGLLPAKKEKVEGAPPVKKDLELRSGSVITFSVEDPSGLKGSTDDGVEVEIKGSDKSAIFAELKKGGDFTGSVNGFHRRNGVLCKIIVQINSVYKITNTELLKSFNINNCTVKLAEGAFRQLVSDGCDWCMEPHIPFEEGVTFSNEGEVFCRSCTEQNDVYQYLNDQQINNFLH